MSPERINPLNTEVPDYDIRADIWSLGISLVSKIFLSTELTEFKNNHLSRLNLQQLYIHMHIVEMISMLWRVLLRKILLNYLLILHFQMNFDHLLIYGKSHICQFQNIHVFFSI